MRSALLFLCGLSFLSVAQAAPDTTLPAPGQYSFHGEFAVTTKLRFEVVNSSNSTGQQRLTFLRSNGYECWPKSAQTWRCKQFQSTEGAVELVRERVEKALAGKLLTLGESRGDAYLISKSETLAEYLVPQTASFGGKYWDAYRLFQMQDKWSVRLGTPTELQFSLENGELKHLMQMPVTESSKAYLLYVIEAQLRR